MSLPIIINGACGASFTKYGGGGGCGVMAVTPRPLNPVTAMPPSLIVNPPMIHPGLEATYGHWGTREVGGGTISVAYGPPPGFGVIEEALHK